MSNARLGLRKKVPGQEGLAGRFKGTISEWGGGEMFNDVQATI